MRNESSPDIRRRFLEFFASKGHRVIPSSSVIPHGDRTLLFTNAGMNQFKDVFLGRERREYSRAATVQKCIRAGGKHNDLDNVGYTARHLTFFEMLGNFSFGDYFKSEAIPFAWELLTGGYRLDPGRLWITVYREDEESRRIWRDRIGVPEDRIVGLGEKDNFWSMGDVGPCGPCSEIHFDRGPNRACGPSCGLGSCDCDRFFEIWNLVFMQFDQRPDGKKVPLPRPSIDTGMGLERLTMVLQGVESVFETDLLRGLIRKVEELTGIRYDPGPSGVPHRVLADHLRSLVFAFADGAEPSNEGRGYVLRRILRRAARYARKLTGELVLARLVPGVVEAMADAYPDLEARAPYVTALISAEEERFNRTLDEGLRRFEEVAGELRRRGEREIPGREVFFLYDTCGFPVDLVDRMAAEAGFTVDVAGYQREMDLQKKRSRGAAKFKAPPAGEDRDVLRYPETRFVGYERVIAEGELMGAIPRGESWEVVLSQTPFYAEGGGQVGDTGLIRGDGFSLRVEDTRKVEGRFLHLATLVEGDPARIRPGSRVAAEVDAPRREAIQRNHTATHLLHAALRSVVGEHLHQKGSLVEASRLRFDVTHFQALRPEEIEQAEEIVEKAITRDDPVETFETGYTEAVRMGAMALFGEKYGERVRVVRIGDFSIELCGGTHVARTGQIGDFGVVSEGSVSSGVRRLEALTAEAALRRGQENARIIGELAARLKCPREALVERVEKLLQAASARKAQPAREAAPAGKGAGGEREGLSSETIHGGGGEVLLVRGVLEEATAEDLLSAWDRKKQDAPRVAALFLGVLEGKVQALVALSPSLSKEGWDAREVLKAGLPAIGGRGGGRPEMAKGAGTRPEGAGEGLLAMVERLRGYPAG